MVISGANLLRFLWNFVLKSAKFVKCGFHCHTCNFIYAFFSIKITVLTLKVSCKVMQAQMEVGLIFFPVDFMCMDSEGRQP